MKSLTTITLTCLALAGSLGAEDQFNGRDLSNWQTRPEGKGKDCWTVGKPSLDPANPKNLQVATGGEAMINVVTAHGHSWDIATKAKFAGPVRIEVELMVPKGSNSGIYVMGEYEVQVLDSHGKADKDMDAGDIGAIYSAAVPKKNASRKPGEWQKFVIDFVPPKFDASGKKTANAKFLKVELNGDLLHENLEMKGPTPGGLTGKEAAEGPLMFQGNHGAVAFRNIKVTPLR
ncbi:MAG: DUF1080 domain-containing protein [Verrucomicrobiales bacterium]